jgi:prepilin-type N-terminal cleavage/methylation domain-containing protein
MTRNSPFMPTGSQRAFTLVELLIVIGIISILALIAVPNFAQAQIRAKVSRALADMRTLTTAIEAYTVDNNNAPYDGEPGFTYSGWNTIQTQMTTPIAYITSVPADPFQDRTTAEPTKIGHTHYIDAPARGRHAFDYGTAYWNDVPNDPTVTVNWRRNFGNSRWKMSSCGPDLRFANGGSYFGTRELYDPTNGVVSEGDIIPASIRVR